ncbi:tetratricopeptide repeat protein [Roseateles oligotrophus]|uniref:Tetratricopeptide repeat protein n=1 Tax=Roseateles oligotrophus TaxID=1769250 RepID=A0ABT2Y8E0_9BURK|nr:tetratricopeptide repeat protein [Roseateles oligotrophus]MCV2366566.1 tetratricopeptide repeat protein [Roseateles oligotrophus]
MPEKFRRSVAGAIAIGASLLLASLIVQHAVAGPAAEAPPKSSAPSAPINSEMDAPLFYQLLVGELELHTGQPGVAYQVLLDAARRTADEELFQRVINIALQARAGDQALIAAKAWRESQPKSAAAHQMMIQLLALLNRPADATEPLRSLLAISPEAQRSAVLLTLPRLFQRAAEPKRVLAALEPVLQAAAQQSETKLAAKSVLAKLALAAGDSKRAMTLTEEVAAFAADSDEAIQLALELLPQEPRAELLITQRLQAKPDNLALQLAYGRALARAQRPAEAAREFRAITLASPGTSSAWFALGTLELDLRHADAADAALREYLKLLDGPVTANAAADGEVDPQASAEARQQTWLLLAQAAELRGDFKAAENWLLKVDSPQRQLEAQFRRASLLARQGKLNDARKLLQSLPEGSPEELRSKLLAESQLLRDAQDWQAAHDVLAQANARLPKDPDLKYEQAMMAEKLGRLEDMESLLKSVIAIKPDHHHAYNALGYSLAERNLRLEEAKALIAKALSFVPSEPFILDSMGWVEFRLGNKVEALRLLRQSYAARPDAEIAAHLGEVLWVSGQRNEAQLIWNEGLARDPKNEALREAIKRLKAQQ